MRSYLVAFSIACSLSSCGPTASAPPKRARAAEASDPPRRERAPDKQRSETKDWSEAQPLQSTTSPGINNRKSRIVVTSDPEKHGEFLHFRFAVNAIPISGVFVAPVGQTTTFTIPVGTVHFTIDECEWETQGFELGPDEEMPIACKLTKEGDCCEVAIPVEETPKKK
jgi:hypothetical protein